MSFKLLAIRPLERCNKKLLKNLKENQIYKFYNDYEFVDGIATRIKDYPESKYAKLVKKKETNVPENLYGDNINVSAIVGKNGSGKSALIELLIATIAKVSMIVDKGFINSEELYYKDENNNRFEDDVKRFNNSFKYDLSNLRAEIYYQHKTEVAGINKSGKVKTYNSGNILKIRCIQLIDEEIFIYDQINESINFFSLNYLDDLNPYNQQISQELFYFLKDLFYTMVINYSHYGFNTNEIGEWVKGIFHKNDGYQLPVVINPYRHKGNIDVNIEKELVKSRFLVNILQEEKLRTIQTNKIITHLTIELDHSKFLWDMRSYGDKRINNTREEKDLILKLIFERFYIDNDVTKNKENYFFWFAFDYLLIKLRKISNYQIYNQYRSCFEESVIEFQGEKIQQFKIIANDLFVSYLDSLMSNFSHVTHKLKQTLFFLQYCYLDKSDISDNDKIKVIDLDELYNWINLAYKKSLERAIEKFDKTEDEIFKKKLFEDLHVGKFSLQHSLPSIFKTEFYFQNEITDNNFSNCSSGEKQKIFSIHSVIYHLRNLISVAENNVVGLKNEIQKLLTYQNINIVFDEIELYAHPDFQRIFVNDLLYSLKTLNLKGYFLNIIFITHSPFILSDIPKENILFLEIEDETGKSKPSIYEGDNTFGANIHEMLTNGFFMESTKSAFAISKINEFLEYYRIAIQLKKGTEKYKSEEEVFEREKGPFFKNLICLVGEDFVRKILENQLQELYNHFEIVFEKELSVIELEEKRALLENELDAIKKKIENEKN